jgi:hypothetical protein
MKNTKNIKEINKNKNFKNKTSQVLNLLNKKKIQMKTYNVQMQHYNPC